MKREELKCPVVDEYYGECEWESHPNTYYYKFEADSVMDAYEQRIKELEVENARLKTQVPVWHTFSEKKPQLRQLILVKYEPKQEYPNKQMEAILWCPMREEELKLDMLTYKEWCELPTTEESS